MKYFKENIFFLVDYDNNNECKDYNNNYDKVINIYNGLIKTDYNHLFLFDKYNCKNIIIFEYNDINKTIFLKEEVYITDKINYVSNIIETKRWDYNKKSK